MSYRLSFKVLMFPVLLFFSSCTSEKISPTTQDPGPLPASKQKLFLVGYAGIDPSMKPAYWKDGIITTLSGSSGQAYALDAPDSTKVYAIGYLNASVTQTSLWTNGAQSLVSGLGNDISVRGQDVYIAGSVGSDAVFWKNGNSTPLTHGVGVVAQANRILVENNNIHVGINVLNNDLFSYTTIYWKNGVPQTISSGALFVDMIISGSDVFILGISSDGTNSAIIWKNGIVFCTFGGKVSSGGKNYKYTPTGIRVLNGDIYVCGVKTDFQVNSPCYWKINLTTKVSGSPIVLPYDSNLRYVGYTSIGTIENDLYISAYDDEFHHALLWKNGTLTPPFDGSSTSPNFFIKRICVVSQ